jgi:ribosomal protein S18 acetylase RimI-like enzyme
MSRIVFKGKASDGTLYLIRYPKRTDLHSLWKYINEISKEKTFISLQGEDITLKEERVFLNTALRKIKNLESIFLVVESKEGIVGIAEVSKKGRAERHTGIFGITLAKEYRSKGIGRKLMEFVISEASKKLEGLKIIRLVCFAENERACSLYKTYGFKEYGRLPGGLLYKDTPTDEVLMYYRLD